MKQIHHIWLTVYFKPEDIEDEIIDNLLKFFSFNLEEQKIKIDRKSAISFEERKIVIFQVHLEKQRHIKEFMKNLNIILHPDQKKLLLSQKESRLDEGNHFFIRFDKDKLIEKNEYELTDKGNCYHLKMSIAAFPTTRDKALKVVDELFG